MTTEQHAASRGCLIRRMMIHSELVSTFLMMTLSIFMERGGGWSLKEAAVAAVAAAAAAAAVAARRERER